MRLIRILAAAAMILSLPPAGMAAATPDQSQPIHLIRGGGHGGGFGGHFSGFHGGIGVHRGFGYGPRGNFYGRRFYSYPYAYACPYPYYYPYCTFPSG